MALPYSESPPSNSQLMRQSSIFPTSKTPILKIPQLIKSKIYKKNTYNLSQNLDFWVNVSRYMVYGTYKRTMATDCKIYSEAQSPARKVWATAAKSEKHSQRYPLDFANRCPMDRFTPAVSAEKHLPSIFPAVERIGGLCQDTNGTGKRPEKAWWYRPQ
jgi:hypothetical protein